MSEHHPRRESLEGFFFNRLPAAEIKDTLGHLLGGCGSCQEEISSLAAVVFSPESAAQPVLSASEEEAYDRAIVTAFDKALATERSLAREREEGERRTDELVQTLERGGAPALPAEGCTWGLCEALLARGWALRQTDPDRMLALANLAQQAADRLSADAYGEGRRADMQARTWAELANGYRLAEDLSQAEAAMACALDLRLQGTGDPLLYARIADLDASLLCDQRRFKEAFRMLDLALAVHRRYSGPHEVGRVLILKGLYTGYAGKPEEGLQLLVRGLSRIDRGREPDLAFRTLHNILLFRVELGEFETAQRQLQRMRPIHAAHSGWLDLVKLHRLEGEIAAGLGDLVTAEATFQQIRQDLDDAGLPYQAALASLDLAGVWLRQGRTAEIRGLVPEMMATFRVLGVEREALSALHLLQDAVERDQASLEILRLVGGILRRLQNEPATRVGLEAL